MQNRTIQILGSQWQIIVSDEKTYPNLRDNNGYEDSSVREIIICDITGQQDDITLKKDLCRYQKQVLRHEVIHAYLAESGLDGCGRRCEHWEYNEEMIDWFAIQMPKIFETFKELDIL